MKPGDRKQRWQSSCMAGGTGMMLFAIAIIVSSANATGVAIGLFFGFFAMLEFVDAKRGWKISYKLPPRYYRDLKSPDPITREIAKKTGEAVIKEAKDPNRKKYAFEKRTVR